MAGKPRTPAFRVDCCCPRAKHEHGTDPCYQHCGRGCRCDDCRAAHAARQRGRNRAIAYGRSQSRVPALGYTRRIQALCSLGWSSPQIAAVADMYPEDVRRIRDGRSDSLLAATAAGLRRAYDELWDTRPAADTPFQRRAIAQVLNRARAAGWKPPMFWDDDIIDLDEVEPHGTHAAFVRHKSRGQKPCQRCVRGESEYQADRYQKAVAA